KTQNIHTPKHLLAVFLVWIKMKKNFQQSGELFPPLKICRKKDADLLIVARKHSGIAHILHHSWLQSTKNIVHVVFFMMHVILRNMPKQRRFNNGKHNLSARKQNIKNAIYRYNIRTAKH